MSAARLTNAKVGAHEYRVTIDGTFVGIVRRKTTSVARNVSNMGGSIVWIAQSNDGTVVTPRNTYRRCDAVDALVEDFERAQ